MSAIVSPAHSLQFSLAVTNAKPGSLFGPRIGSVVLRRASGHEIRLDTPTLLVPTSRGVVPHLSRDHCRLTHAIRWVNVPFETFLEQSPPILTLQKGSHALHTFLGYAPGQHILSMSARNPADGREMPPNGSHQVSVQTLRGVRKLTPSDWTQYTRACQPDVVFALPDTPFTQPPYSQKRLTKSIERSAAWLLNLITMQFPSQPLSNDHYRPSVFVQMAGSTSISARRAFSQTLLERLDTKDAEAVAHLGFQRLDDGVAGYSFDLVPLQLALSADRINAEGNSSQPFLPNGSPPGPASSVELRSVKRSSGLDATLDPISSLLHTSLSTLSSSKPRLVNSARGPHQILNLVEQVGIDLFDANWAIEAASVGVALDFTFPISGTQRGLTTQKWIGHNLYRAHYAFDFLPLADSFVGAATENASGKAICSCAACSPAIPVSRISHDSISSGTEEREIGLKPAISRAYLHHLLQTHEMSAHAFLVMHNLTVVDRFFDGIRAVISTDDGAEKFKEEAQKFRQVYSDGNQEDGKGLMEEATACWREVDLARGKGRLKREKDAQENTTESMLPQHLT